MDRARLYELLKRERIASEEEKTQIDEMSVKYPYFHALHTLRCAIKYQDSYGARDRVAAIRVMAGALPRPIAVLDMVNGYDALSVSQELEVYKQEKEREEELEREKAEALAREQEAEEKRKRIAAQERLEELRAQEEVARLEEEKRQEELRAQEEATRREEIACQREIAEQEAAQRAVRGEEVDGVIVVRPSEKVAPQEEEEMVVHLNVMAEPFKFIYENEDEATHRPLPEPSTQQHLNDLLHRTMAEEGRDIMPAGVFELDPEKQEMANQNMEFVLTVLNPNYRPPADKEERIRETECVNDLLQEELIDTFIASSNDVIKKVLEAEQKGDEGIENPIDLGASSAGLDSDIASETLARVYANKGMYVEAEAMYRTLMQKYPEKSAYFAELIEMLPSEQ